MGEVVGEDLKARPKFANINMQLNELDGGDEGIRTLETLPGLHP